MAKHHDKQDRQAQGLPPYSLEETHGPRDCGELGKVGDHQADRLRGAVFLSTLLGEEAEEPLRTILAFVPYAFYLTDMLGNFIDGNRAAEEMIGYDREELIGQNFLQANLLSRDQLHKAAKLLMKNSLGQETGPDEFVLKRKDGRGVVVEIRTSPVRVSGHNVVLGVAGDVTELRRTQQELRKTQAFLQAAVAHSPEGILMVDAPDGDVLLANNAALGLPESTTRGLSDIPPELHPMNWQISLPDGTPLSADEYPFVRAVRAGRVVHNEEIVVRHLGGERWLRASATPVRDSDGEIVGGIGVLSELADRMEAAEAASASRR